MSRAIESGWDAIHANHELVRDAAFVRRMHAAGKGVGVWTPNRAEDLRRVIACGVDRIITDEPELAAEILRAGI